MADPIRTLKIFKALYEFNRLTILDKRVTICIWTWGDTHHKKHNLQYYGVIVQSFRKSNKKGMIPIAKNISVVDELGNEYEATYPKRAKGLVKNGRARFVSENKICLVCPPNTILEDLNMSDNIIKKEQVFTQIAELQKDLESIDKILFNIQCVTDSQQYVESDNGDPLTLDYMPEVALEKIKAIREIVMSREHTINSMLSFYLSVYNNLENAEKE